MIADRRAVYERTGDPSHLEYEKWFAGVLAKFGRMNPEIRRNFYLEDTVEEGNFISRERFTKLGRAGMTKGACRSSATTSPWPSTGAGTATEPGPA